MATYNLTTSEAVAAAAKEARAEANREYNQDSYNAAWLHGYASALAEVAKQQNA